MSSIEADYEHLSDDDLRALFVSYLPRELRPGFYRYRGYCFTSLYVDLQESFENLEVFNSDIWITSVPKSGTTWLSEAVWSICHHPNAPEANTPITQRVRFLEYSSLFKFDNASAPSEIRDSVRKVKEMPSPRLVKSHLPWDCLPAAIRKHAQRPRVIHIARNFKDVAVSYLHHTRIWRGYTGPPELFYEIFLRGLLIGAPYEKNVNSYWTQRDEPNVLFLFYEEMKHDLRATITKLASFLDVTMSDDKMAAVLKRLSFEEMKRNANLGMDHMPTYLNTTVIHAPTVGDFLRKGETGSHRNEMSAKMAERFDAKYGLGLNKY